MKWNFLHEIKNELYKHSIKFEGKEEENED